MSKIHCFEFSALLQAQRRQLLDRVREKIAASGECLGFANQPKITEDDGPADATAEMDVAMVIRESQELQDIEAALVRIGNGSYGICIDCGGEIGRARLKADSTAKCCLPCQILVLPISLTSTMTPKLRNNVASNLHVWHTTLSSWRTRHRLRN